MGRPLPLRRRKPLPRHALPDGPTATAPKRRDGTTIGVILVLVVTSGFVAGTTATFTGTTTNAGNVFAGAALGAPISLKAVPEGNNVKITWKDAGTADDSGAGYRVSASDVVPPATTCTGAVVSKIGVAQSGVAGYTDTGASARTNFTDGRVNCFQIQTSYPCCPEGINPWLSQDSATSPQANPQVTATLGVVLLARAGTNVAPSLLNTLNANDYFEFTFNQPIDITAATFPAAGVDTICTDAATATESIWIGLNGNAPTTCPKTTGTCNPACTLDTVFKGFRIAKMTANSDTGNITNVARYAIQAVAEQICTTTPGCFKVRITVGTMLGGTAATTTGSYSTQYTGNATYLKSTSGAVKACNHGTATTISTFSLITGDPTGGKCILKNGTGGF